MTWATIIKEGREAYQNHLWAQAYSKLSIADQEKSLKPEYLIDLAVAAYLTGKDNESTDIWSRAHTEFLNIDDKRRATFCAFWMGMIMMNRGERVRSRGWFARAHRLINEVHPDCAEQGFLFLPEGLQHLAKGDGESAYSSFRKAVGIGEQFNNTDLMILGKLGCGQARIAQNRIIEGTELLDEVMVDVESDEVFPIAVGIVYCGVVESCHKIYDYRRTQEWTSALSHWCDSQPEMVPFRGECMVRRAEILQWHGKWADAMDEVTKACKILTGYSAGSTAGQAYYRKAELHRLRGEYSEAEAAYHQANKRGKKPQPGLSLLRLSQNKIEAAKMSIRHSLESSQDRLNRSQCLPAYIEIMLATGETQLANTAADELSEIAEMLEAPYLQAIATREKGAVLLASGNPREALAQLEKSWHLLKDFNLPLETARIRILTGMAHRQLGDTDTAEMEIEAAKWLYNRVGAKFDLNKIEDRFQFSSATDTHGLTQRELQVLQLIATGKTNRDIGSELYISERTVDRHVSNILLKLDVASRTEATSFAFEHNIL